jgi:hypothetical protein
MHRRTLPRTIEFIAPSSHQPHSRSHYTYRLYVKSLYKRYLTNALNWYIRRDLWREKAIEIRAEFERNRWVLFCVLHDGRGYDGRTFEHGYRAEVRRGICENDVGPHRRLNSMGAAWSAGAGMGQTSPHSGRTAGGDGSYGGRATIRAKGAGRGGDDYVGGNRHGACPFASQVLSDRL